VFHAMIEKTRNRYMKDNIKQQTLYFFKDRVNNINAIMKGNLSEIYRNQLKSEKSYYMFAISLLLKSNSKENIK
jgi:hypothetical protein